MTIIVQGNPIDGFGFYGPFEDHEEAIEWAARNLDGDWWSASITQAS